MWFAPVGGTPHSLEATVGEAVAPGQICITLRRVVDASVTADSVCFCGCGGSGLPAVWASK